MKSNTTTNTMTRRGLQLQKLLQPQQEEGAYILCTRYKVQTEMKMLFDSLGRVSKNKKRKRKQTTTSAAAAAAANQKKKQQQWYTSSANTNPTPTPSVLFPNVSLRDVHKLRNQYMSDNGKENNLFSREKESRLDCVARLVSGMITTTSSNSCFNYQTIIVDEAHFCKNVLAFWGLGLSLLCSSSKRNVLLTGTPYNNSSNDMAALMTYIDPSHKGMIELLILYETIICLLFYLHIYCDIVLVS